MTHRHGTPIWYELMSKDPLAERRFYSEVVGWQIDEELPAGSTMDYRMISAGDGLVGGVFRLTDEMGQQGASPCWMMYIGVDDVDACVAAITSSGGAVLLPAFDIANVGRIAMVSDPQGAAFYVMRGASNEDSTACDPERAGHGAWRMAHGTNCIPPTARKAPSSTRRSSVGASPAAWTWGLWAFTSCSAWMAAT